MQLNIGKICGPAATSSEAGVFNILAFDHRQFFARILTQPTRGGIYFQRSDKWHVWAGLIRIRG